jgi:hypothetical protein
MNNVKKSTTKTRYSEISKLGTRLNLSFSSLLSLGNKIIALDGIKKKLLVLNNSDDVIQNCVIDLDKVSTISLKKNYNTIKAGELKKKGLEKFLESIFLQFEYPEEGKVFSLPFYEQGKNELNNLSMLERNARNWQMILLKMIAPAKRNIK